MPRIEMPENRSSFKQQIVNYMFNVDFNKFLETSGASNYFNSLNEEQKWQYQEDFWYFVSLCSNVSQQLIGIEFPIHKK